MTQEFAARILGISICVAISFFTIGFIFGVTIECRSLRKWFEQELKRIECNYKSKEESREKK